MAKAGREISICDHCITSGETYTEAYRHACEVRFVLSLKSNKARHDYCDGVRAKRGHQRADMLIRDVRAELSPRKKSSAAQSQSSLL